MSVTKEMDLHVPPLSLVQPLFERGIKDEWDKNGLLFLFSTPCGD